MAEQEGPLTYKAAGVNYSPVDAFKKQAMGENLRTLGALRRSGFAPVPDNIGQSAGVVAGRDFYLASTLEALGTKDMVAKGTRASITKSMEELTHRYDYYYLLAKDLLATILNDLVSVGARPIFANDFLGAGPNWFDNPLRTEAFARGWVQACIEAGVAALGGETQVLTEKVDPEAVVLAGDAVGIIQPKERFVTGERLQVGDAILLVESSGIHTNGLTLARRLAERLPEGYLTRISDDGPTYGDALLEPSHIYVPLVMDLLDQGLDLHYLSHITGHGWSKLMRANKYLTYVIDHLPPTPQLFRFIQQRAHATDQTMFETFNMGAGYAIMAPQSQIEQIIATGQRYGLKIYNAGYVMEGPKQVVITEKQLVFPPEALGFS